jgi:hypothetical protein
MHNRRWHLIATPLPSTDWKATTASSCPGHRRASCLDRSKVNGSQVRVVKGLALPGERDSRNIEIHDRLGMPLISCEADYSSGSRRHENVSAVLESTDVRDAQSLVRPSHRTSEKRRSSTKCHFPFWRTASSTRLAPGPLMMTLLCLEVVGKALILSLEGHVKER